MMEDGFFDTVHEILNNGRALCDVLKKERSANYFKFPTVSSNFHIYYVNSLTHTDLTEIPLKDLEYQGIMLPVEAGYLFMPMVHLEQ